MRELTFQEQEQASGGLFPLFGWAFASASVVTATYKVSVAYGRGSSGGGVVDTGSACVFVP